MVDVFTWRDFGTLSSWLRLFFFETLMISYYTGLLSGVYDSKDFLGLMALDPDYHH